MRLSAAEGWAGVAAKLNTLHDELRHDPFLNANISDLLILLPVLIPTSDFSLGCIVCRVVLQVNRKYAKKAWERG